MSFSELLTKAVESVVVSFIDAVSSEYSIPKDELLRIFNGNRKSDTPKDKVTQNNFQEPKLQPSAELNKLNKNELISHCKAKGLKTTGTKQELIDRLTGANSTDSPTPVKKPSPSNQKKSEKSEDPPVITKGQSTIQPVQIKKNAFGNFEHSESGLVFDKFSQKVIGKQNPNGKVDSLTDNDIDVCNKYKFRYNIPENLNTGSGNSVAVEGLDEDEEDDDGTDIINEAEELLEDEEELLEDDDDGGDDLFEEDD